MRSCRLEDSIYLKVKHIAEKESRSFNNFIESLLKEYVAKYEKENGVIEVNVHELYK